MVFHQSIAELEVKRTKLQTDLDDAKSASERNALGQFATPQALAIEILEQANRYCSDEKIRFLDPAIGTGSFFSALCTVFPLDRVIEARGYEVDHHYGEPARKLWRGTGLDIRLEDFTRVDPDASDSCFNFVVCNPPYVRHHHLRNEVKRSLGKRVKIETGVEVSGLAGLYCYFITLSHRWMAPGALACWLVPSEFMDVNYGAAIKKYLLDCVSLVHIHRFDPSEVQFGDALVSSSVVWFRNDTNSNQHRIRMTYGGSMTKPSTERYVGIQELRDSRKWTRLPYSSLHRTSEVPTVGDFFRVKRGIATGDNRFFILKKEEIDHRKLPWTVFRPILPSPRELPADEVECDDSGNPILNPKTFLLDCRLPLELIKREHPALWDYLEEGRERGVSDRYVCSHRTPWYAQEDRPAAPIVCTYLGRVSKQGNMPFRFILNRSRATAANVYLMLYPKDAVSREITQDKSVVTKIWNALRKISPQALFGEGRVYGGGLYKLEPKELANVPATALSELFPTVTPALIQTDLFEDQTYSHTVSERLAK